jgi:hypothetical protein
MNKLTRASGALLLATMLYSGTALAQSDAGLPAVQTSGTVQYLSGGIGLDESTAIKSASAAWPLTLEFSVAAPERALFASGVKVEIRDGKGVVLLGTTAAGPYLLAKLAPGAYRIEATLDGKALQRQVQIKTGQPQRVALVWPAGTNQGPAQ